MRIPILLASAAALALAACDSGPFSGQSETGEAGSPVTDSQAKQLREALKGSIRHGLTPDLFFKGDLDEASGSDLHAAVLAYASALALGKVDPTKISEVYTIPRPKVDVKAGFEKALSENRLAEWLDTLPPQTEEYRKLSQAFVHYAELASKTPDTNLPPGKAMKQGISDPRVPALVEALKAGGYLQQPKDEDRQASPATEPKADLYTAEVAAAVKRMQQDFGLKADGIVGNETLRAVNTSARDRARQLAVALERLRWLERDPPATRIDVNAAATQLAYWRAGRLVEERRVVVGQPGWETPQLASPIFQLVANPTWTVPDSIVEEEISKKSGAWLAENNFVRKNGRWVQQPGRKNSLGLVKFDMKNGESIYLHDTPAKALFALPQRHESHGCVRVQGAVDFARLLAEHDGVLDKFDEALASGEEEFVDLETEIPVRLLYHTAFVGSDGRIGFVEDVYGWDNDVAAALGYERRQPKPVKRRAADVGP